MQLAELPNQETNNMKTCATCKFASRCKTNDYLCRHPENAKLDVWERVKEWHNTCQQWEKKETTKKPTEQ